MNSLTEDTEDGRPKCSIAGEGCAGTVSPQSWSKYPARAHTSVVISLVASTARSTYQPTYTTTPCVRFNKALRFSLYDDERLREGNAERGWRTPATKGRPTKVSRRNFLYSAAVAVSAKLSVHYATSIRVQAGLCIERSRASRAIICAPPSPESNESGLKRIVTDAWDWSLLLRGNCWTEFSGVSSLLEVVV